MTLKIQLEEQSKQLDELTSEFDQWVEHYNEGNSFPDNPDMSKDSYKLNAIRIIVTKMCEVAEQAELLREVTLLNKGVGTAENPFVLLGKLDYLIEEIKADKLDMKEVLGCLEDLYHDLHINATEGSCRKKNIY